MVTVRENNGMFRSMLGQYEVMKEKVNLRFTMQWITSMEMEIDNGRGVEECAQETYTNLKNILEPDARLVDLVNILAAIWEYGVQLLEWYRKGAGSGRKKVEYSEVRISKHARKRMHTRCGLGRKAQEKVALQAYREGLKMEDANKHMKEYMVKVMEHTENEEITRLRVLNDKIFIFKELENCCLLITTMQIPNEYLKYA